MRALPSRFQLGDEFLGVGFPRIVEGRHCPSAKIADRPYHFHSRSGGGFGSLRRFGFRSRCAFFGLKWDSHRLGRFRRGPELSSIQRSSCHFTVVPKKTAGRARCDFGELDGFCKASAVRDTSPAKHCQTARLSVDTKIRELIKSNF
jgi:hypothetical protein